MPKLTNFKNRHIDFGTLAVVSFMCVVMNRLRQNRNLIVKLFDANCRGEFKNNSVQSRPQTDLRSTISSDNPDYCPVVPYLLYTGVIKAILGRICVVTSRRAMIFNNEL